MALDLIDRREVPLPATALELVDADLLDVREVAVGQTPVDRHAHRPMDGVAGGLKPLGDLLPPESLGAPGEELGAEASVARWSPAARGTASTCTPQRRHDTRRIAYSGTTDMCQRGTKPTRLGTCVS